MYRSASWTRVSEDYTAAKAYYDGEPPPYEAAMEMAKKEKSRAKFAENAVHVIPFVLLACALVLWLVSNPDVDVGLKGESIAARIEGLTIEGDIDNDSDGTQTGFLGAAEVGDSDKMKHLMKRHDHKGRSRRNSRKLVRGFK
ncbi:PREDICTED: uncharacterized protein LOC104801625 [Tarenaya hassleriana]|uniref:Transmembrane protein n=1 Tax=Tarenaya spinosa TaxID=228870 RepID=T1SFS1_9ROSI|nr:PREDICTED: uncharacterized protein LOC104801625 [Tarenaya hassleriana]AGT21479.1 hypothetical protein [Tarenaya spinosa]